MLPIRVGIDFGTAFTKAAIRVAGQVLFLDWDGLSQGDTRYLLGGEVSEMDDREALVGRAPGARHVANGLKLPFLGIDKSPSESDLAHATVFLSWTMRYARAWLYKHYSSLMRGPRLIWEVNLGAPTGSLRQNEDLLRQYRRIGLAAWKLSQEAAINLASAAEIVAKARPGDSGDGLEHLDVIPEFMAQVAGYIKSPQRTDGLYLLMDVGAGTLDVACFRLHEDSLALYESQVESIGAHYLMQVRQHLLQVSQVQWNGTENVPSQAAFARMTKTAPAEVKKADAEFEYLVERIVSRVISKSRAHMDRAAKEWHTELPVFMAGGGAKLEPYRSGLAAGCQFERSPYRVRPFPPLNALGSGFAVDDEVNSRMSVAYGLTFGAEEIGTLRLAQASWEAFGWRATVEGPNRDDLYPK